MNNYLNICVDEFERVSGEIGLLPAILLGTLIILMTVVGSIVLMILVALIMALSPLVLAIIWLPSYRSVLSAISHHPATDTMSRRGSLRSPRVRHLTPH